MVLVSSCLLGINCKYNGSNNYSQQVEKKLTNRKIVPVCPEVLGGLSIPRPPAEIKGGSGRDVLAGKARVVNEQGTDISKQFIVGAKETLKQANNQGCKWAVLKARSPSCGSQKIYDGSFTGQTKLGAGVAAALLLDSGIKVINEENLDKLGGE